MMPNASDLWLRAHGRAEPGGSAKCFWCGRDCDGLTAAADSVRPTCTVRQYVAAPNSSYACLGCTLSMSERWDCRVAGEDALRAGKRVRSFSWLITADTAIACTKAHLGKIRNFVLSPPQPPWAACLADSGQRHLLWATPVNTGGAVTAVNLEDQTVRYRPEELADRLGLASRICAAAGKPRLRQCPDRRLYQSVYDYWSQLGLCDAWSAVWAEPVSQLAAWLVKPMKECRREYDRNDENGKAPDGSGQPQLF